MGIFWNGGDGSYCGWGVSVWFEVYGRLRTVLVNFDGEGVRGE